MTTPVWVGFQTSLVANTVILFFSQRLPNTYGLYTGCGCHVLLVEYRGYGRSEGTPSESGKKIISIIVSQLMIGHYLDLHCFFYLLRSYKYMLQCLLSSVFSWFKIPG